VAVVVVAEAGGLGVVGLARVEWKQELTQKKKDWMGS
jgi:hypothetical protein